MATDQITFSHRIGAHTYNQWHLRFTQLQVHALTSLRTISEPSSPRSLTPTVLLSLPAL